ncbi:MAG: hypothetical protein M3P53_00930 [Actinomycetota bacterium]|nr:hypothetical protein [Actinomycetota bacterium]
MLLSHDRAIQHALLVAVVLGLIPALVPPYEIGRLLAAPLDLVALFVLVRHRLPKLTTSN